MKTACLIKRLSIDGLDFDRSFVWKFHAMIICSNMVICSKIVALPKIKISSKFHEDTLSNKKSLHMRNSFRSISLFDSNILSYLISVVPTNVQLFGEKRYFLQFRSITQKTDINSLQLTMLIKI